MRRNKKILFSSVIHEVKKKRKKAMNFHKNTKSDEKKTV